MAKPDANHILRTPAVVALLCACAVAAACTKSGTPTSSATSSSGSAPSANTGGGDFEGTIAMKMTGESQRAVEMTYFIKGQHTRIETKVPDSPEGTATMLWDLQAAKMTTLIPSRKMYMTMDLKEAAASLKDATAEMKQSSPDAEEKKFPKLTPTGREETIAGYPCQHWLMGDKQELDMCVAKGLGYFGMGGQSRSSFGSLVFSPKMIAAAAEHPEWVKLLEGGAFPLKLTSTENGNVKMTMEATRIEKKSLEDSLFTIPPDYKELNMPYVTPRTQ
ncbi:MAG TPA: DUF4412 domain-containing protein [Blastocatellia bacterium]|nr:DUF4412 domain-containing protein [Blastocatellia bacterium]